MRFLIAVSLMLQSPHHAVEILSFTGRSSSIHAGESATLEWKTRGVETVSIDVETKTQRKNGLPASGTLIVHQSPTHLAAMARPSPTNPEIVACRHIAQSQAVQAYVKAYSAHRNSPRTP